MAHGKLELRINDYRVFSILSALPRFESPQLRRKRCCRIRHYLSRLSPDLAWTALPTSDVAGMYTFSQYPMGITRMLWTGSTRLLLQVVQHAVLFRILLHIGSVAAMPGPSRKLATNTADWTLVHHFFVSVRLSFHRWS